jgi:hypothetical protein
MVLVFVSVGHDTPCGNGRAEVSDRLALTPFMPSIKKNIDMIFFAPF